MFYLHKVYFYQTKTYKKWGFFVLLKGTLYQPIEYEAAVDRNEFDYNVRIHNSVKLPSLIKKYNF